ncbi:hypothetical protein NMY22_g16896 [Coprinellus aureogranulatus]|nr:hypothetical protein NMY22_g16896 [Coprinellus aureogranulatus]
MNTNAPKLVPSPSFLSSSKPLRSSSFASSSSSFPSSFPSSSSSVFASASALGNDEAYILSIHPLVQGAQYAVATSSPANAIHIVDAESLKVTSTLRGPEPSFPSREEFSFGKKSGGKGGSGAGAGVGGAGGREGAGGAQKRGPQAHYAGVTCVRSAQGRGGGGGGVELVSCGKEGSVVVWDVRSGGVGIVMTSLNPYSKPRPLLSLALSPSGTTIAAGSELQGDDAVISFFDPRNPSRALREHTSTHSDDITVLEYAPSGYALPEAEGDEEGGGRKGTGELLLSGSTDGLLSISDPNEEDEDEAVLATANWGCSVAQAGFIHPSSPSSFPSSTSSSSHQKNKTTGKGTTGWGIWASSDMETFSTWSADLSPVLDFDVRDPGVHGQGGVEWVSDYVVGVHSGGGGGGNGGGGINLTYPLRSLTEAICPSYPTPHPLRPLSSSKQRSSKPSPWYLHTSYTHSHVGVVRALYVDDRRGLVVTGGEDARLNVWRDLTPSSGLYAGNEMEDQEDEEGEEEGEGDEGDGMDVDMDGPEEREEGEGKRRKRGVSLSDDEMDGRKRRR